MGLLEGLAAKEIKRRDFMKLCAAVTAAFSLPKTFSKDIAYATEKAMNKPAVIWLQGQDCTGCSESLLSTINPSVGELVLDTLSIRYHEAIMAASGHVSEYALQQTMDAGGYVLIVEGSIPKADDRYCEVGGKAFKDILVQAADKAAAIIAVGSCAAYGGIPGATPSQGGGVGDFIKNKPIINLPTCPVKPSRLVATVMYYLATGNPPALDKWGRPVVFYGNLIHDNCPRRGQFDKGNFLKDWNDPEQRKYCLLLKGCKGPKTYADCAQVWWNEGANFCINAGAPCAGCAQPEYYKDFTPLYDKQEMFNIGPAASINLDTVGPAMAGAAVAGAAIHAAGRLVVGKKKDESQSREEAL